jgi:hypothetical protein
MSSRYEVRQTATTFVLTGGLGRSMSLGLNLGALAFCEALVQ